MYNFLHAQKPNASPPMSAAQTFLSTAQRLSDMSAIAREAI
jgi:hypothetical protein